MIYSLIHVFGPEPQLTLSEVIVNQQLNTLLRNVPDDELEKLLVEDIVQQILSWMKKSGHPVPEVEGFQALAELAEESLIQVLQSKHLSTLAQINQ